MAFDAAHQPAQATALLSGQNKVTVYNETGGGITDQFASHNIGLLPAIPPNSIVHDNCCGAGTVSRLLLSTNPPPSNIKIFATDIDQVFLDVLQSDVDADSWPVEVSNQRAESLSFADNHFTHSFTNNGIFVTSNAGLDGAREIYRTLQPGGTAVVNCWETISWLLPFELVHEKLRPGKPYPPLLAMWKDGKHIRNIMREVGFEEEKMRVERSEGWARTSDLRSWAEKGWAFLGGLGGWAETDGERWDEAVDLLVGFLKEQEGVKVVDGEFHLRGSQWVVVATK